MRKETGQFLTRVIRAEYAVFKPFSNGAFSYGAIVFAMGNLDSLSSTTGAVYVFRFNV